MCHIPYTQAADGTATRHTTPLSHSDKSGKDGGEEEGVDSDWERDASDLYQWSQNLSLEDVG